MEIRKELAVKKVKDVFSPSLNDVHTVFPATAIYPNVLDKAMKGARSECLYVVDESGRLQGLVRMKMVTRFLFPLCEQNDFNDFIAGAVAEYDVITAVTASDIMDKVACPVTLETGLSELARLLVQESISEFPVVDAKGILLGTVGIHDIIGHIRNDHTNVSGKVPCHC